MTAHKYGRLPRSHDPRIPHLSALLAGQTLPAPPPQVDWTRGMPAALGMMLNDRLGCCTCAAFYHAIQVWSFNASGKMTTEPDRDVEQLYIEACGYNPNVAGEGPGGQEQTVLGYLLRQGAPMGPGGQTRARIAAFVEVDPRNLDDVRRTIADCGVAYIGFQVPQYLVPDDGPAPEIWDVQPGQAPVVGGHAVILAGYDATRLRVISWGRTYTMTWAFFAQYVDEVYAIADAAWIASKGTSPAGLSLVALEQQMQALAEAPGRQERAGTFTE